MTTTQLYAAIPDDALEPVALALEAQAERHAKVAQEGAAQLAEEERTGEVKDPRSAAVAIYRMLADAAVLADAADAVRNATLATDVDGSTAPAPGEDSARAAELEAQLEDLRAQLADADLERTGLITSRDQLGARITELDGYLTAAGERLEATTAERDAALERIALLESKIEPVLTRLGQLEAAAGVTAPLAEEVAAGLAVAVGEATPPGPAETDAAELVEEALGMDLEDEPAAPAPRPLADEELAQFTRDELVDHVKAQPEHAARAYLVESAGRARKSALDKLRPLAAARIDAILGTGDDDAPGLSDVSIDELTQLVSFAGAIEHGAKPVLAAEWDRRTADVELRHRRGLDVDTVADEHRAAEEDHAAGQAERAAAQDGPPDLDPPADVEEVDDPWPGYDEQGFPK